LTVREDTEEVPLQLSRSGNICRYCRHPGVTPVNVTVQGHADPMDALHLMKGVELRRVERSGEEWRGVERSGEEWRGVEWRSVEKSGEEWRRAEEASFPSIVCLV
jgi:hypothetical protein